MAPVPRRLDDHVAGLIGRVPPRGGSVDVTIGPLTASLLETIGIIISPRRPGLDLGTPSLTAAFLGLPRVLSVLPMPPLVTTRIGSVETHPKLCLQSFKSSSLASSRSLDNFSYNFICFLPAYHAQRRRLDQFAGVDREALMRQ